MDWAVAIGARGADKFFPPISISYSNNLHRKEGGGEKAYQHSKGRVYSVMPTQ
jgi:hypothetical protein